VKLNAQQQACVDAIDGVYAVIAGPGSGKTSVLVQRHLNMLSKGIPSSDILNLTFTHAAASEMADRSGLLDTKRVFRTFHSFAIELLKKEKDLLPFKLNDTVIPVEMEDYKLLFDLVKTYPTIKDFRTLQDKISEWKRSGVEPDEAIKEAERSSDKFSYFYSLAYRDYEYGCRNQGWLDFDSVMQEAVWLLEMQPEVVTRHQRKYISVDECQDTDVVQFRMLQLIFDGNIFVVGDENQLIYEWRSAQPGNLTNFCKLFPDAKTLFLGQNFRSTGAIVGLLKEILPVDNGIASHMITEREYGEEPEYIRYMDSEIEADRVLAAITDPLNTAVLARTNRQLFIYQRLCAMRGIKYKILGKKDFFDQNEIKRLLAFAKDSIDLRPAPAVLTDLIQRYRMLETYKHAGRPMESNPIENLNDLVKMAANKGTIEEFLTWLRKLKYSRRSVKGLTLSTVHQAKGREYKHVFVIGAHQGSMPHRDGELLEEKRIFYVALSRASDRLTVSCSKEPTMFLNNQLFQIYTPPIQEENNGREEIYVGI
jgi:superfamily I DNA/RNA helicase